MGSRHVDLHDIVGRIAKRAALTKKATPIVDRIVSDLTSRSRTKQNHFDGDAGARIELSQIELKRLARWLETTPIWLSFGFDPLCDSAGSPLQARPVASSSMRSKNAPELDLRVTPDELLLPGVADEHKWKQAEALADTHEKEIFKSRLSPLNKALFFKSIYLRLLRQESALEKQM